MRLNVWITGMALMGSAIMSSPVHAKTVCPANGKPYAITGRVKEIGTTTDGQTYYSIYHPRCGSSEDNTIAVYPPSAVAACVAGAHASARGAYDFSCPEEGDILGGVCVARLENAALTCK